MNSDNTRQREPATTRRCGHEPDGDAEHVVLVADSDPRLTDEVADLLRGEYVVRTAYTSETVLAAVDDDVSVVVLDPSLPNLSVGAVVDRLAGEAGDDGTGDDESSTAGSPASRSGDETEFVGDGECPDEGDWRLAALTERRPDDDRFDGHVGKPVSPDALRSTVDRLCRCVAYRDNLDRYYAVARARASLPPDDPQRERLDDRIADLESELDGVADGIDGYDAYEAALRNPAADR